MGNRCVHCDFSENAHDHEGHWCKGFISQDRMKACIEACEGIPTDQLGEVKKAWLAMQLWTKFGGFNHTQWFLAAPHMNSRSHGGVPNVQKFNAKYVVIDALGIINTALEMRALDADFGELNALLDSAKEER